jgi:hypothetical protein
MDMRVSKGLWGVAVLACLQMSSGIAATRPGNALKLFLEESMSRYSGFVETGKGEADYEDVLYAWAKAGDDIEALRRKTAEKYGLPPAAAARVVDLTLERGALGSNDSAPARLATAFEALAHDYPKSDFILVEATRTVDDGSYNACNVDDLHRLLEGRADADSARLRMYDAVWCQPLLTERTTLRNGDTKSYLDMATRSTELDGEWLKLAVLRIADEKAMQDAAVDDATRVDVRKRRVLAEMEDGRIADALAALPSSPEERPALTQSFDPSERRAIAAAHFLQGDNAHARAWLATAAEEEATSAHESNHDRYEREAGNYQLAMLQRALAEPARDDFAFLARYFKLRSSMGQQMSVWVAVFQRLAVAQGYPGLVDAPYKRDVAKERKESLDYCYHCAPELIGMIERLASTYVAPQPLPAAAGPQLPALVRDRMARALESPRPAWVEHAMPAGLRTPRVDAKRAPDAEEPFVASSSRAKGQPAWAKRLPSGELVRYAQQDERIVAITASQSLDPTGEISSGGYWVSVSEDGGKTFAPPLYTGLRMYAPYVVLPQSKMSMIEGDRLRLEVAVRKLDDKNVMLPPISLPFLEERDDAYVEATLADLARDSDGDGLTDLAEWAMMLAPDVADTDGDGIDDAADPLPHVAATGSRPGADAMAAGLNKIFGESLGAIITTDAADGRPGRTYAIGVGTDAYNAASTRFMAAPPAYFAGLALKSRVIVLDPAQLDRLSEARGTSFAMGIETFEVSHDGTTAIMVWSTGWAGGTYLLKRRGDGWEIDELAGWIT